MRIDKKVHERINKASKENQTTDNYPLNVILIDKNEPKGIFSYSQQYIFYLSFDMSLLLQNLVKILFENKNSKAASS